MVKKSTVVLYALLFSISSFSQTLSLSEMEKLLDYNISDFEDYVITKGFEFLEIHKNEDTCDVYVFSYDRNLYNDNAISFVNLFACPTISEIHQQFPFEKKYLEYKNAAKTSGYKYYNTRNKDGIIISEYYTSKYFLNFASRKAETGITRYGISLGLRSN